MEAVNKLIDVLVSTIVPLQHFELPRHEVQRRRKGGRVFYIPFINRYGNHNNSINSIVSKSLGAHEKIGSGFIARI